MTPNASRMSAVALCALVLSSGRSGPAQARPFDDPPRVVIELLKNRVPVAEGQSVSGTIRARLTVTGGIGRHVDFYGNMVPIDPVDGPAHMEPDADLWVRNFFLNTSMFYDGENLLSAHLHTHGVPGEPFNTELVVGTFKIVSENGRVAPDGDRLLPVVSPYHAYFLNVYEPLASTNLSAFGALWDDDPYLRGFAGAGSHPRGQILTHLGNSVLGRPRWPNADPPFPDPGLAMVNLVHFQRDHEFPARLVHFFSDSYGRANYAYQDFTIPAVRTDQWYDRDIFDLPALDARILNVNQGDEIVIPPDQPFVLQVHVSNIPDLQAVPRPAP